MSARIVEDLTINKAVTTIMENVGAVHNLFNAIAEGGLYEKTRQEIGTAMLRLNYRSVNERYGYDDTEDEIGIANYRYSEAPCSLIEGYKALQCWMYQACEGHCDETQLYKTMQKIEALLAMHIVKQSEEWRAAPWG